MKRPFSIDCPLPPADALAFFTAAQKRQDVPGAGLLRGCDVTVRDGVVTVKRATLRFHNLSMGATMHAQVDAAQEGCVLRGTVKPSPGFIAFCGVFLLAGVSQVLLSIVGVAADLPIENFVNSVAIEKGASWEDWGAGWLVAAAAVGGIALARSDRDGLVVVVDRALAAASG